MLLHHPRVRTFGPWLVGGKDNTMPVFFALMLAGGKDMILRHPATLALAGLVSGCISFRKNWKACQ